MSPETAAPSSPEAAPPEAAQEAPDLRCTWHPERETGLRCFRCDRPMCPACARPHPVGMRCKECARELRAPIYKVTPGGYAAAAAAALILGALAGTLTTFVVFGFGFYGVVAAFFLGGALGAGLAESVGRAAGRKRGRGLERVAIAGLTLGVLVPMGVSGVAGLIALAGGRLGAAAPFAPLLAGLVVYLVGGVGAIRARLR